MITLKKVNKKFPLKSGMCVCLTTDTGVKKCLILFGTIGRELCYTTYDEKNSWDILERYEHFTNPCQRIEIFSSPSCCSLYNDKDKIYDSDRSEGDKIVELTLDEIADKFGVKRENVRIKL